jgi:hypothetical protein
MLRHAVVLVLLATGSDARGASTCTPADCLKRISARVAATLVQPDRAAVVGVRSSESGLLGSDLRRFADSTYVYTEWADIEPETIYDKGTWAVGGGLLTLSPDADVSWDPGSDRRYLFLREKGRVRTLLFGVDRSIEAFEGLVADEPRHARTWLRLRSLQRTRRWTEGEEAAVKADLTARCWNPAHFKR